MFYKWQNNKSMGLVQERRSCTALAIGLRVSCINPSISGVLCQKQVSRTGTSNYIPQILLDISTCPRPGYLLLAPHSSCTRGVRNDSWKLKRNCLNFDEILVNGGDNGSCQNDNSWCSQWKQKSSKWCYFRLNVNIYIYIYIYIYIAINLDFE